MAKFVFDFDKKTKKGIIKSDFLDNLREHFSVKDELASLKRARFGGYAPTRKYAITPSGRFDVGLFPEIYKYIKTLDIPFKVIVTELFKSHFKSSYEFDAISSLNKKLRDYQEEVIKMCLSQGSGTVIVATAGGKTLIMATLVKTVMDNIENHKTLIIVPDIQLVEQTYGDFIEYGIDKNIINKWSGKNELDKNAAIIVASMSILQSKKQDISWLTDIDLLIVDEVHKFRKQNKINKILKQFNTKHHFGFTGTMPEDKLDQWNITGKMGPILYEKPSHELRDDKYIADAIVQILNIDYKNTLHYKTKSSFLDPTAQYNEECDFVYTNKFRNGIIAKLGHKVDKNILILVDRIKHGQALKKEIESIVGDSKKVYFIRGSVDVDDREKIRKLMETQDNIICVAITKIFSTGINIKNLHYILFASPGKAKIKIIQSIGRGLRLHENKNKLIIFDIADNLIYGNKHLAKRLELYKKEKINYAEKTIREN